MAHGTCPYIENGKRVCPDFDEDEDLGNPETITHCGGCPMAYGDAMAEGPNYCEHTGALKQISEDLFECDCGAQWDYSDSVQPVGMAAESKAECDAQLRDWQEHCYCGQCFDCIG